MSGLSYVGVPPSADQDIANRIQANTALLTPVPNRASVTAQINALINGSPGLASTTSVASTLSNYIQQSNVNNTVTNLLLLSQRGVAGGVATLDNTGKIPTTQVPVLGAPWVKGPYGPTQTFAATSSAGSGGTPNPAKFAEWNIGAVNFVFQPLVYMNLFVEGTLQGRPVVEVWINSGPSTTPTGTLIAKGVGRAGWADFGVIAVHPSSSIQNAAGSGYAGNYTTWITAWVYDANGQTVTVNPNNVASASAFLWRVKP